MRIKTYGSHILRSSASAAHILPMANAYIEVLLSVKELIEYIADSHFRKRKPWSKTEIRQRMISLQDDKEIK